MPTQKAGRPRYIPVTYWIIARVLRLFVLVYFPRLKAEGTRIVPKRGAVIIVSNHLDYLDPVVLLAVLPRRAMFLAMSKLFDWPVVGFFTRLLGAVPVPDPPTIGFARKTLGALGSGEAVVVFPEEELSSSGSLQPASPRAAMLAYRSGALIVPVAITGTERLRWPWLFLRPFLGPKVTVRFGEPIRFVPIERATSAQLRAGADEIMLSIAALLRSDIAVRMTRHARSGCRRAAKRMGDRTTRLESNATILHSPRSRRSPCPNRSAASACGMLG